MINKIVMTDATRPGAPEMQQWLAVDETAKTMLRRLRERCMPSITPMPPLQRAPLHGRNVLEIAGPSGSGKSELLLQVCPCGSSLLYSPLVFSVSSFRLQRILVSSSAYSPLVFSIFINSLRVNI